MENLSVCAWGACPKCEISRDWMCNDPGTSLQHTRILPSAKGSRSLLVLILRLLACVWSDAITHALAPAPDVCIAASYHLPYQRSIKPGYWTTGVKTRSEKAGASWRLMGV
jgi:hypothetical protein